MKKINLLRFASICIFIFYISFFAFYTILDIRSAEKTSAPVGIDFAEFYAAGNMAVSGDNIYDVSAHHLKLETVLKRNIPSLVAWFYPPTFLFAIIPFSFLPYYWALIAWLIITFLLTVLAIKLLVSGNKYIVPFSLGFPGVLMNIRWGQNAFLSTALLGFGLYFIEMNPVISGVMFGLLTYKPQMAVFPFLILLLLKKWRVLFWACVTALLSTIVSGLIFGLDLWINFINSFFGSTRNLVDSDWINIGAIQPSLLSILRIMGVNRPYTYIIIGLVSIITTFTVWWIWRKTDNITLKGSAMVLGIFIIMPYYIQYDLMILVIPFSLLIYDFFEKGCRQYEILILCFLWAMPLVNWPLAFFTKVQICPAILFVTMGLVIYRVLMQIQKDHNTLLDHNL